MNRSKVFFLPVKTEKSNIQPEDVGRLFYEAGLASCVVSGDLVAVKAHFGEEGNVTHIKPKFLCPVVEAVERADGVYMKMEHPPSAKE
jgi:uncharacterized Fe-S center protein